MAAPAPVAPSVHHEAVPSAPGTLGPVLAWAALALLCLARGYRGFLITLVLAATVPMLWSWSSYDVRSGSMEPSISVGDIVVAQPFSATEKVPVGRVMIFDNPATPEKPELLVHRVVERRDDGLYTTAGDANAADDTTPVARDRFRARATILVPFVGRPLVWLDTGRFTLLLSWLALTAVACALATRRRRTARTRAAPSTLQRVARALRMRTIGPVLGLAAAAVLALGGGTAAAAFTSTTADRGMTWQVSGSLVDNLVLASPGDPVRGTVPLTASLRDSGGLTFSVRIEYAPAGTTSWQTICTKATAPYTCSWTTTGLVNQGYDLRAVATSGSTTYTSDLVAGVLVDNAAPSVTLQDPGTPLRGTVTLAATATDAHSGVARVVVQYAATGTSTWATACTATQQPWSCAFDTTAVPGGNYSLRAVATDLAGNATTSVVVANRVVDNTVSTVVVNDPGPYISGTITLTATASSSSGVASVRIQGAPAGSGAWGDVCTDTTSPYTCSYDSRLVADGMYDLRAIMLDGAGKTTISATITNRKVDNTAPLAVDVQTANGTGTAGKVTSGDIMTFTYSEVIKPASLSAGWDGNSPLAVTLRLRDGNLLGLGSTGDTVDVQRSGAVVNLGSVNLRQDYISTNATALFAATLSTSTTIVNGISATRVTLTVGTQTSGPTVRTVTTSSTMMWAPSTLATDLASRPVLATAITESGTLDREF